MLDMNKMHGLLGEREFAGITCWVKYLLHIIYININEIKCLAFMCMAIQIGCSC